MNGSTYFSGYSGAERRRHPVPPYFGEERRSPISDRRTLDEAYLLRRAASGYPQAFVRLYDRYVDHVFEYIYYNIGDRLVAEQLTDRVFKAAWRDAPQAARTEVSFGPWLYRLAHNAIVHDRPGPTTPTPRGDGREESRPSMDKEPSSALAQLGDEQRQVLILRFRIGLNTEQVAQILGKPPAAIRTLQHHGLDRLGAILRKGAEK